MSGIAIPSFWGQFPATGVNGCVPFVTGNSLDYTIDVTFAFYYIPSDAANLQVDQNVSQITIKNGIRVSYDNEITQVPTVHRVSTTGISGRFRVPSGDTLIHVDNPLIKTAGTIVLLTPEAGFQGNDVRWEVNLSNGSFLLTFSSALTFDSTFAYLLVGVIVNDTGV